MSKVPCGGFELDESLALNNGKLGLAPGAGGSQADWNVTDSNDPAFIKNKPFGVEKGAVIRSVSGLVLSENTDNKKEEYPYKVDVTNKFNPFDDSFDITTLKIQLVVNGMLYDNISTKTNSTSFGYQTVLSGENCPVMINSLYGYSADNQVTIYSKTQDITSVKVIDMNKDSIKAMSSDYIEFASTTSGSTKKFKITVDDSGTISATEITT